MNSELAIVEKLIKIPSTQGRLNLSKLKDVQLNFFIQSLTHFADSPKYFSQCVKDIFSIVSFTLRTEQIALPDDGMIVISNHLGINKLTKIHPQEIKVQLTNLLTTMPALENNDPFTLLFAPIEKSLLKLVAGRHNYSVIYVFMQLNNPIDEVLSSLNAAIIERTKINQYSRLNEQIKKKIQETRAEAKVPIVVIFPEGGTSGKEIFSDPYSLIKFKSGYKHLARDFELPILPIGVTVDADLNYYATVGNYLNFDSDIESDRHYLSSLLELR